MIFTNLATVTIGHNVRDIRASAPYPSLVAPMPLKTSVFVKSMTT